MEYPKKSQNPGPRSGTCAINVAVQALAQHELKDVDKAIATLEQARGQFTHSQSYAETSRAWPHAAKILFREAEVKINGSDEPKPSAEKAASSDQSAESSKQD